MQTLDEIIRKVGNGLWFKKFLECFHYGLPQAICNSQIEDTANALGRFKKQREETCQYPSILKISILAMIWLEDEALIKWGLRECELRGISFDDRAAGLQKWLEARAKIRMVETNEMVKVFCKQA